MRDTISKEFINTRKIIIEVRYVADPSIIDKRGKLTTDLLNTNFIPEPNWQVTDRSIQIDDSTNPLEVNKVCYVDQQRIAFSMQDGFTNESFTNSFEKLFKIIQNSLSLKITRIGCRIQGTYNCHSTDYDTILANFISQFPNKFFFEPYKPKDLFFRLVYENGMYSIGPIKDKNDEWYKQNFPGEKYRVDKIGFAIDTDNFILSDSSEYIDKAKTKAVYTASIAIEKSLFELLNSL